MSQMEGYRLRHPGLWRAISLLFSDLDSSERNNRLLSSWIARSRSLPLSVNIDVGAFDTPLDDECIQILILHRARWEHLDVKAIIDPEVAFSLVCEPTPSLRHISLSFNDDCETSATLVDAPLLRSANISSFPDVVILPWSQLTRLILKYVWLSECSTVLRQATSLHHCELALLSSSDDDDQPITLPFLQSLVFLDTSDDAPGYIESFVVPALRTIQVPDSFLGVDPILSIDSFITKSGCSLKKLCITRTRGEAKRMFFRGALASIPKLSFEAEA
ncbi:hypothetical protein C8R43DRAFT_556464 [Mycena crocata]|nr:hypothetical protein C8R43DRAFT_556464 [Mycena crocata]